MATHKKDVQVDPALRDLLKLHDPGGMVDRGAAARLEMRISEQALQHTQCFASPVLKRHTTLARFLISPLYWPMAMSGAMALGLLCGLFLSSLLEAPVQGYNSEPSYSITTAMAQPWDQFMQ